MNTQIICCLGPDHKCIANVNNGHCCAAGKCIFKVLLKKEAATK